MTYTHIYTQIYTLINYLHYIFLIHRHKNINIYYGTIEINWMRNKTCSTLYQIIFTSEQTFSRKFVVENKLLRKLKGKKTRNPTKSKLSRINEIIC